jgi:triosephosphate isomerase
MYKTIGDTMSYLQRLHELTADLANSPLRLFVIPSYTSLDRAGIYLKGSHILLGAQNMCWEKEGQFTGEISPVMLKETGVSVVEIGHSERRHIFAETDEQEEKKVKAAIACGFTALLCIGETKREKEYGISDEILSVQLKKALYGLKPEDARKVQVAYEPVWAIGVNGVPAAADYVLMRHRAIRSVLCALFGNKAGNGVPLLYGGSVNKDNAVELTKLPDVDGLFIGRSAWDAEAFNNIIRQVMI